MVTLEVIQKTVRTRIGNVVMEKERNEEDLETALVSSASGMMLVF